jgi:hypothetical protein
MTRLKHDREDKELGASFRRMMHSHISDELRPFWFAVK